jgi:hypothetical protein
MPWFHLPQEAKPADAVEHLRIATHLLLLPCQLGS